MYVATNASDLPEPFKRLRHGCEYYFLAANTGLYSGLAVVFEVNGRYEEAAAASKGVVGPNSPFRIALRTGRGSDKIQILRVATMELD